jgi:hypothetical protein
MSWSEVNTAAILHSQELHVNAHDRHTEKSTTKHVNRVKDKKLIDTSIKR